MKKFLIALCVGIIIIFVIRKYRTDTALSQKAVTASVPKPTPKNVTVAPPSDANPASRPSVSTSFSGFPLREGRASNPMKDMRGLCQYSGGEARLISLADYTAIRKTKSRYFVMPLFHAQCLSDVIDSNFKIVEYSFAFDKASDVLGDIELSIRKVKDVEGLQALTETEEFKTDLFGFKNIGQMIKSLGKRGVGRTSRMRMFEIVKKGKAKVRKPSGDYIYFPGITFYKLPPPSARAAKRSGPEYAIELRMMSKARPKNDRNLLPYIYELDVPYVLSAERLHPLFTKYAESLKQFSSNTPFFILAKKNELKYAINFSNLLKFQTNAYYVTATIVKVSDDYKDIGVFDSKESSSGILSYKDLKSEKNMYIDTRADKNTDAFVFKRSYSIPVSNEEALALKGDTLNLDVERLKSLSKDKRIILIGIDSFDPGPSLVKKSLAKLSVFSEVYSPGFKDLELRSKLGLVPKWLKKKLARANYYEATVVQKPNGSTNSVKKVFQKKVHKPKSLRDRNSRPYLPKDWNKPNKM